MTVLNTSGFLNLFKGLGYEVLREEYFKPYHLNIVGVRNKYSRVNYFDDRINIYYETKGEWIFKSFEATTYPGTPLLLNPLSKKGTAILKEGQYKYMKGLHKNKYEALVQRDPVVVYRDANKDLIFDRTKEESGFFGINIHKASLGAKLVGPNSAGCQVVKEGFDEFMFYINKALNFRVNEFIYTLVEL